MSREEVAGFRGGRVYLGAAICVAVLLAVPVQGQPPTGDGWKALSSRHVTLLSDGEETRARGLLYSLEAMRAALFEGALDSPSGVQIPTTVMVFTRGDSYAPFRLHDRSGQFFATPFENLIAVEGRARSRSATVIAAHEYLHALVSEQGARVPLWLNEGLAEYYSTIRVDGRLVHVGSPPARHRRELRGHAFIPFDELFTIEAGSREYLEHEGAGRFYAQSWLLVHYLMSHRDRAGRVAAYLAAHESANATPAEVFERAFDLDTRQLDTLLRRYLNQAKLPGFDFELPVGAFDSDFRVENMQPVIALTALGGLATEQVKWDRTPERVALAQTLLSAAAARAPEDGDVAAARAYLAQTLGDPEAAESLYERALYLDARNGRSYALYAQFLLRSPDGPTSEERVEQARLALERALELSPGHRGLQALQARLLAW